MNPNDPTTNPTITGWKIVCPDDKERHYPYINHGDALCDAGVFERDGCNEPEMTECHGQCPGGEHTVEPIPFHTVPNPVGLS